MFRVTDTFKDGKIGRRENVAPLEIAERNADDVARAIFRYAGRFLLSRGIDVDLSIAEDGTGDGIILVGGFRTVAEFTLAPTKEA